MNSYDNLNLTYFQNSQKSKVIVDKMFNQLSSGMSMLGPLFILALFMLISLTTFIFFKEIIPFYIKNSGTGFSVFLLISGLYILLNLLFNFIMSILVKPGTLKDIRSSKFYKINKNSVFNVKIIEIYKNDRGNISDENKDNQDFNTFSYTDCSICQDMKIARSHHCKVCKKCVFKMDHHCPWINNCVGLNNQRYFILFLTWLFFGCCFINVFGIPSYFFGNSYFSKQFKFVLIISLVGSFMVAFFNIWNWYLIYKGFTSVEFWSGYDSEFSLKDWRDNMYLVFGTRSILSAIFHMSKKSLNLSGLEWSKIIDSSLTEERILEYDKFNNVFLSKVV